ncbi:hypothetical protein GCM10022397_15610 [Flavivirga jejuensis]
MLVLLSIPQTLSGQTIQEELIGTWTFDYQASLNSMAQKSKTHFNEMNTVRKSKLSSTYKNRKITFNTDGSYVQVLSDGRTTNANWATNTNNNLAITNPNGKTVLFKIKKLETNSLILSQINTTGSMNILFTNWHLTKN